MRIRFYSSWSAIAREENSASDEAGWQKKKRPHPLCAPRESHDYECRTIDPAATLPRFSSFTSFAPCTFTLPLSTRYTLQVHPPSHEMQTCPSFVAAYGEYVQESKRCEWRDSTTRIDKQWPGFAVLIASEAPFLCYVYNCQTFGQLWAPRVNLPIYLLVNLLNIRVLRQMSKCWHCTWHHWSKINDSFIEQKSCYASRKVKNFGQKFVVNSPAVFVNFFIPTVDSPSR